jgi:CheY-like chemotaxis protein
MTSKLRILLLEDSVADAALIEHELEANGFSFTMTRVETEEAFRQELEAGPPDLILSDHNLPELDGFKALEIVRVQRQRLPFIFVSGSNDQGMVVEMYEQGATDYVFKRDLGDLRAAVTEALDIPPEALPPVTARRSTFEHPELELNLSPAPPFPKITPVIGHLFFCPQCRRARDEEGRSVLMEDYCGTRQEIIVLHRVCTECKEPLWWK